jgi:hypothetical protein
MVDLVMDAFVRMFFGVIVIAVIVGASTIGGIWFFTSKNYIKSSSIIVPKKVFVTDGIKVDTIYYYYAPKK